MELATNEYAPDRLNGFVQADITAVPFPSRHFAGVLTLGFMHRVPREIRVAALGEIARVCSGDAIISFSLGSAAQRMRHISLRLLRPEHVAAPALISREEAEREIRAAGFSIVRRVPVAPLLSAESLFLVRAPARSAQSPDR